MHFIPFSFFVFIFCFFRTSCRYIWFAYLSFSVVYTLKTFSFILFFVHHLPASTIIPRLNMSVIYEMHTSLFPLPFTRLILLIVFYIKFSPEKIARIWMRLFLNKKNGNKVMKKWKKNKRLWWLKVAKSTYFKVLLFFMVFRLFTRKTE